MALAKLQLSELLETYGLLLTDKQRSALSMYCDCDCSLAEIADERGISRQGVRDAIVKGEALLVKYEQTLHLCGLKRQAYAALSSDSPEQLKHVVANIVNKE